jgi:hypothetical protein
MNPRYAYIYGLKDPHDGLIHYVGKSNQPEMRLQDHLANKVTNKDRVCWIQGLMADGQEPVLVILDKVLHEDWRVAEIYWIARGWEEGWPLTNIHAGGNGGEGQPQMPDYSFMRDYITDPVDWARFEQLGIWQKDGACLEVARVMAQIGLDWLGRKGSGQAVESRAMRDWRMVLAGQRAAVLFFTSG